MAAATAGPSASPRDGRRADPAVQSVTTAPAPASSDRDERMRRYVIQMSVRTLCFVGAVFTTGWVQILLIVGAVVLPYVAVVGANNKGPEVAGSLQSAGQDAPALPAQPSARSPEPEDDVVSGVVVEEGPRALTRGPAPRPHSGSGAPAGGHA